MSLVRAFPLAFNLQYLLDLYTRRRPAIPAGERCCHRAGGWRRNRKGLLNQAGVEWGCVLCRRGLVGVQRLLPQRGGKQRKKRIIASIHECHVGGWWLYTRVRAGRHGGRRLGQAGDKIGECGNQREGRGRVTKSTEQGPEGTALRECGHPSRRPALGAEQRRRARGGEEGREKEQVKGGTRGLCTWRLGC